MSQPATPERKLDCLSPEQFLRLWPKLHPLLEAACNSNDVAQTDISPNDIYYLVVTGQCVIFCFTEDGEPELVFAIQFSETNGHKGAEFIALAGRKLVLVRDLYWQSILDWLKANGVEFIDIYSNERIAKIHSRLLGFNRRCVLSRKVL